LQEAYYLARPKEFSMNRETTNKIRFLMEECLPPIVRDSTMFRWLMERVWGRHIRDLAAFRRDAPFLTPAQYEELYRTHPRVHEGSDNSEACIRQIIADIEGAGVCDVGCGTGYLLRRIKRERPDIRCDGVDLVVLDTSADPGITLKQALIEKLPFADGEFDSVVCTHVLEHILDYRAALSELRRIAGRRLIIVVPLEREGRYTFNPHFNFYPYPETFLRAIFPVPPNYQCKVIGRDIYYVEDKEAPSNESRAA
jgi:SAM-dependent methyltransferase